MNSKYMIKGYKIYISYKINKSRTMTDKYKSNRHNKYKI